MTAKAAKASTKKPKTTKAKAKTTSTAVVTKPAVQAENSGKKTAKQPKGNLRAWNLRLGIFLLVLAVAVVVVGNSNSAPLTTQYLAKDALATEAAGKVGDVLAPATRHLLDVPLSWLVAKFLAIFGLVFVLAATLLRRRYETWLTEGVNKLRWAALGLGGGTVFTTVAMLSGVSDVSTLCLVWGSVVLASLLAAAAELLGAGRRLRRLLGAGAALAVFLPWLIFLRTAVSVPLYDGSLPMYMYYLYASLTLLVVAVALGLFLRLTQRGKWAGAMYTEKAFMVLSLAVAVLPALQIFAGALQ